MLIHRPRYTGAFAAAVAVAVMLGAANLLLGDLNQDEGWYLYAAGEVAEGRFPYRDFAFTQGPMLPLVYSLITPWVEAQGLAAGRGFTWLLGLVAALLAASSARRLGGRAAQVMAFALIGVNVYHSYFTTVVKTYALCALFLAVAVYALVRWVDRRAAPWLVLAGAALALAAGTRISSGALLPVVGLWLLFNRTRWGTWSWFWFGVGGGVTLLVVFVPFLVTAREGFLFGLLEFHTLREAGSFISSLVFKGGFVSRLVQAYGVATILVLLLAAAKVWRPFRGHDSGYHQTDAFALVRMLWVGVGVVTLVHLSAPFPYDDYQVPLFPVLAVALSVSWAYAARAWSSLGFRWRANEEPADPPCTRWLVWGVVLAATAAAFSSPINQEWMIAGRDRIWWNIKPTPSLLQLRDEARRLRAEDDSGILLTQDTYLAVEAGLKVPRGWEMGPFSYYPDWSDERAEALHLVNRNRLERELATSSARFAAFSGYGLGIASPAVQPVPDEERAALLARVAERYVLKRTVPRFGQAATTLEIYRRRDDGADTP
ncbi:MAG TPA: glycosyltransferase family 39 protein [Kiritimatiellia bacterium]|nr:glycosyltransferase family 39 protein [Kiritimatiellia bacterium]HMP35220.1 glycosyltransferase family 39 protein [Kiritimatiellia bacterium]